MIEIAIMGHGVVGSGVAEVIINNKDSITAHAKETIDIKYILDLRDFDDLIYSSKFIKDFNIILNDPSVRVVVETMGGLNPAYDFVKRCLLAGKSVVTSNKELVAVHGAELLQIAKDNNVNFLFEASVGGGIPILRPLNQCLAANEVYDIAGILNGTTNFILTKMIDEQMSFDDALSLAQKLGYAEKNPAADVEGFDTCRKICILAALAFGEHVYPDNVHTEGITKITLEDVEYAQNSGYEIKLIGRAAKEKSDKIQVWVAPTFISKKSQLSTVNDVFNGIIVWGNAIGEVMFYGKGAGKLPTASAVVADVIDCVKHLNSRKYMFWNDSDGKNVESYEAGSTSMYIRLKGENAKCIAEEFYKSPKFLSRNDQPSYEAAFLTETLTVGEHNNIIDGIKAKGIEVLGAIRVF